MTAKKMFYSMGEVSEMFDVNPSLIRHWESKFDCLRPHKNKKGNRMFSPSDVEKLKQIYHLVKERGMTLEGANRAMKRSGGGISRDTELLERLQRIRAALEEVREELRDGGQDEIVDADVEIAAEPSAMREMSGEVPAAVVGDEVSDLKETPGKDLPGEERSSAEEAVSDSAQTENIPMEGSASVGGTEPEAGRAEDLNDGRKESPEPERAGAHDGGPAAAVSPKSRTRRRRKGDEEDKELFPFYEQSLF